ncbi:MAG: alpha/beta fold hydrolase [Myxococcales bacterium]|nr:alpha/beta fold hydrolase [Myxococcales bacterium]
MRRSWWLACGLVALALGCDDGGGDSAETPGAGDGGEVDGGSFIDDGGVLRPEELPTARFALAEDPGTTPLGAIPWPSDVYRTADGHLDLRGFPQRAQGSLLDRVCSTIEAETPGFATAGTMYATFESLIDPVALPANSAASIQPGSALLLVDIDPDSPEYGSRWPVNWRIEYDRTLYLPNNALSVRLVEGFALRPSTTYALIVTEAAAKPSSDFQATLAAEPPEAASLRHAWDAHAPLRAWLRESGGVRAATASVFTTQDPVGEMFRARDFMHTLPAPTVTKVESQGVQQQLFELFTGTYHAPRFQEGNPPYINLSMGTGAIRFDGAGDPIVQADEELRFSLAVPIDVDMPADGWPVVLYGHGTGGDYLSFINARVAASLAQAGIAVLSMDQIHHGPRDPRPNGCPTQDDYAGCVGLSFFNFVVPTAGRDNVRQSALDFVSLMRLGQGMHIEADVSTRGREVRINPEKIMYMGHSQGGINGPLFLAIEPEVRGGVLSAAGATIAISIEQKTRPLDVNALVSAIVPTGQNDVLDRWHPTLMLLQTFIEPGDPINYARFWFHEPAPGQPAKSIFMTAGLDDEYTPPDAIFALAAAGRVPIIQPVYESIELFDVFDVQPAGVPPYAGNVAGGQACAGLAQFPNMGHFVVQDSVSARNRYRQFFTSLAAGRPQIY